MKLQLSYALLPEHMQFAFTDYFINETRAGYRDARHLAKTGNEPCTNYPFNSEAGHAYAIGMAVYNAIHLCTAISPICEHLLDLETVNIIRKAADLSAVPSIYAQRGKPCAA